MTCKHCGKTVYQFQWDVVRHYATGMPYCEYPYDGLMAEVADES